MIVSAGSELLQCQVSEPSFLTQPAPPQSFSWETLFKSLLSGPYVYMETLSKEMEVTPGQIL